jgi:hypothetical protein
MTDHDEVPFVEARNAGSLMLVPGGRRRGSRGGEPSAAGSAEPVRARLARWRHKTPVTRLRLVVAL